MIISDRLKTAVSMIEPGAMVADIGTDHGYLPIWLALNGRAEKIIAADLREKPLEKARKNAARFGVSEQIDFRLCFGLDGVAAFEVDTVVICGMGADKIADIVERADWLKQQRYRLILQPMSSFADLRKRLYSAGFGITLETPVLDQDRIFTIIRAEYVGQIHYTPSEIYVSRALLNSDSEYRRIYIEATVKSLEKAVNGTSVSKKEIDKERRLFFMAALDGINLYS